MNKQLLVILMGCLVGWLMVLTYILVDKDSAELSPALERGESATVAYVHGDSIQRNYAFIAAREQAMFLAVQQSQMALERVARPLQEEAQELIAYANGADATAEEVGMAQNRLYEIEAQMNQMQSQSQSQLVQLENALQAEVAQKLTEEVAEFARENGLEVVLNWGLSGEGVLYGAPAFDVTEALLQFMNDRYDAAEEVEAGETETAETE